MPLSLELAQTVAIGAFNPFIITPEWLMRSGVYPQRDDVNIRLAAVSDGAAFRFDDVEWQVDHRRLIVTAKRADFDCGQRVSDVLGLLPHTPVQAVGHNFHFTAGIEDWGDRPSPMLGTRRLEQMEGAEQVRWVGAFRRHDVRIEVTLAYEAEAVAALFNHHRNLDPELIRQAPIPEERIAPARKAAEQFQHDFQVSRELLRDLFGMET